MRTIRTFTVIPSLPEPIAALNTIANNLWWTWHQDAVDLFIRIDRQLWEECGHNPVAAIGMVSQSRLNELAQDEGFLAHLNRVKLALDTYLNEKTWYDRTIGDRPRVRIAYFSAEFGLHESLPIYSGGLGLLAGDHCKSASGLGLPFVAVGLFYYNGYCRQYLNHDGWQQEYLAYNDFNKLPCTLMRNEKGAPLLVRIELPEPQREVALQIWSVNVGRIKLYLLDAKLDGNRPEDRALTDQLYGGDHEHRIKQEIVLGIGGLRALRAMGLEPEICHMNEGHSAFLALERIRILVEEQGMSFEEAREALIPGNVFTTHTPVPAGNDMFGPELMDKYFITWYERLRLDRKSFMALGRNNPHNEQEPFCMTILALKTAGFANGVSKLHGEVSRKMWQQVYPEVPVHEIPITSITNGCHIRSYVSDQLDEIFTRYCGAQWSRDASEGSIWNGPDKIPDGELWRVHERCRARLVTWARERVKQQLIRRGATNRVIQAADEILDPEALTIGFARRFATYKRGTLLFRDLDRLSHILNQKDRPVQILYAGKAHPKDEAGKRFIQEIYHVSRDPRFHKHILFLEDYEINVARYLVQGVDVWLNNPRRPLEASGTSGMKAAANGGLNCSILDGWWCEGYDGTNGWAIGHGEEYSDLEYQDQVESRALYDLLEQHIIPMFYTRSSDGLPREWIGRMKRALKTCIPQFSTLRMVRDYAERFYIPAGERWLEINREDRHPAKALWHWKLGLFQNWAQIRIEKVETSSDNSPVGGDLEVRVLVHLSPIDSGSVDIQAYTGPITERGNIDEGRAYSLICDGEADGGRYRYSGRIPCAQVGRYGFAVRVIPKHRHLLSPFIPGLITWE